MNLICTAAFCALCWLYAPQPIAVIMTASVAARPTNSGYHSPRGALPTVYGKAAPRDTSVSFSPPRSRNSECLRWACGVLGAGDVRLALFCVVAACGGDPCDFVPTQSTDYRITSVTLPKFREDYSFNPNQDTGSHGTHNQLGTIVALTSITQLDLQGELTRAISSDTRFFPAITLRAAPGTSDAVKVELAGGSGSLCAVPTSGTYNATVRLGAPLPIVSLHLPFPDAVARHLLVKAQFSLSGGTLYGQLQGGIPPEDAKALLPDFEVRVAVGVTQLFVRKPPTTDPLSQQLSGYLDNGGSDDGSGCKTKNMACTHFTRPIDPGTPACRNPGFGPRPGVCADACDGIVDTCEVMGNHFLFDSAFEPDVQLLSPDKTVFAPSTNTYYPRQNNDSLSFGFEFTASPSADLGLPVDLSAPDLATNDAGAIVDGGSHD